MILKNILGNSNARSNLGRIILLNDDYNLALC